MSIEPFEHDPRTRLVFGDGSLSRLGDIAREIGARRALLVTDPGIVKAGHVARALERLDAAGVETAVFDGVEENPSTLHVQAGLEAAREARIDSLIGLGGGSSMDSAKGINFLFTSGGAMKDYWGIGKARAPMLPLIAVPTTAGTGSESQSFALITDPITHQKMACGDRRAAARVALLDPELTLTQPRLVAAATGIDAISHAVETAVTTRRNPVSRAFSREAWRLLIGSLPEVLEAPGDLGARGRMLLGASLAGAAIESSMLGATHSAANPLTARHGTVHGHAIGILLPHVVRFNAEAVEDDYSELLLLAGRRPRPGEGPGDALAGLLDEVLALTGLPRRLSDCGIGEAGLGDLARDAVAQWTAQFNPRPVTEDGFLEIYRCAL